MPRQKIQMTEQAYQARLQYYESLEKEAQDRLEAVRRDAKNDVERYRMAYEEMKKKSRKRISVAQQEYNNHKCNRLSFQRRNKELNYE